MKLTTDDGQEYEWTGIRLRRRSFFGRVRRYPRVFLAHYIVFRTYSGRRNAACSTLRTSLVLFRNPKRKGQA